MRRGYIRVSGKKQNIGRQLKGLEGRCDRLQVERLSAKTIAKRPVFKRLIETLQSGDVLVIWDLDRAFRSAEDAIVHERLLRERGVKIEVLNDAIDTSTAQGNRDFQTRAVGAEFERRIISERTLEGLKVARKAGSKFGRPPKMTKRKTLNAMRALEAETHNIKELSERYGVAPWTITRAINRLGQTSC